MRGQPTRTLNLNPIVENANVYVICNAVIAMNDGICDDFVQSFRRIDIY